LAPEGPPWDAWRSIAQSLDAGEEAA